MAAPKGAVAATAIFMVTVPSGDAPPPLTREKQASRGRSEPADAELYAGDRGRSLAQLCSRQRCWRASPGGALLAYWAEDGVRTGVRARFLSLLRARPI